MSSIPPFQNSKLQPKCTEQSPYPTITNSTSNPADKQLSFDRGKTRLAKWYSPYSVRPPPLPFNPGSSPQEADALPRLTSGRRKDPPQRRSTPADRATGPKAPIQLRRVPIQLLPLFLQRPEHHLHIHNNNHHRRRRDQHLCERQPGSKDRLPQICGLVLLRLRGRQR